MSPPSNVKQISQKCMIVQVWARVVKCINPSNRYFWDMYLFYDFWDCNAVTVFKFSHVGILMFHRLCKLVCWWSHSHLSKIGFRWHVEICIHYWYNAISILFLNTTNVHDVFNKSNAYTIITHLISYNTLIYPLPITNPLLLPIHYQFYICHHSFIGNAIGTLYDA